MSRQGRDFIILIFLFLSAFQVAARSQVYANKVYVQMHQNKSKFSRILSNFECNQVFQLIRDEGEFYKVKFATYEGYILSEHLDKRKSKECFQDNYRKFMEFLDLGVSDMHYWGRLQDLYVTSEVNP